MEVLGCCWSGSEAAHVAIQQAEQTFWCKGVRQLDPSAMRRPDAIPFAASAGHVSTRDVTVTGTAKERGRAPQEEIDATQATDDKDGC